MSEGYGVYSVEINGRRLSLGGDYCGSGLGYLLALGGVVATAYSDESTDWDRAVAATQRTIETAERTLRDTATVILDGLDAIGYLIAHSDVKVMEPSQWGNLGWLIHGLSNLGARCLAEADDLRDAKGTLGVEEAPPSPVRTAAARSKPKAASAKGGA
jgi:hypothetical protein